MFPCVFADSFWQGTSTILNLQVNTPSMCLLQAKPLVATICNVSDTYHIHVHTYILDMSICICKICITYTVYVYEDVHTYVYDVYKSQRINTPDIP